MNRDEKTQIFFQRPAISFRISQDYFENNLSDPNNDYTLNNGYYERTVEESDLDFAFGENDRELTLKWELLRLNPT